MAFGRFDQDDSAPMAEINTTPLVDVMLVLLVVFIITAPLLSNTVKLNLPSTQHSTTKRRPKPINLSIDAQDKLYWNNHLIKASELDTYLQKTAQQPNTPLQLFIDKTVRYETVAQILASAQHYGLHKIGLATHPAQAKP